MSFVTQEEVWDTMEPVIAGTFEKFADGKQGMGIREVPEPTVGPQDLLVEVGAVGICGSDLHIWRDEKEHRRPVTLGHEFSGVVIDKGERAGEKPSDHAPVLASFD